MEELLLKIIKTLGAEVPELSYIDEDYGQLEMLDEVGRDSYPLTFPALLVDCASVSWSNIEGYSQKGTATVRVRLLMDCYDDTHFGSGGQIEDIRNRAELVRKVHEVLEGMGATDTATGLVRTESDFRTLYA